MAMPIHIAYKTLPTPRLHISVLPSDAIFEHTYGHNVFVVVGSIVVMIIVVVSFAGFKTAPMIQFCSDCLVCICIVRLFSVGQWLYHGSAGTQCLEAQVPQTSISLAIVYVAETSLP